MMINSVRLVCHQVSLGLMIVDSLLLIPCGMVKVVAQLAHAAHSTIHRGFINNYMHLSTKKCRVLVVHRHALVLAAHLCMDMVFQKMSVA